MDKYLIPPNDDEGSVSTLAKSASAGKVAATQSEQAER